MPLIPVSVIDFFFLFSFLKKRKKDRIEKKKRRKKVMSKQVNQKKREMFVIGLVCGSVGRVFTQQHVWSPGFDTQHRINWIWLYTSTIPALRSESEVKDHLWLPTKSEALPRAHETLSQKVHLIKYFIYYWWIVTKDTLFKSFPSVLCPGMDAGWRPGCMAA